MPSKYRLPCDISTSTVAWVPSSASRSKSGDDENASMRHSKGPASRSVPSIRNSTNLSLPSAVLNLPRRVSCENERLKISAPLKSLAMMCFIMSQNAAQVEYLNMHRPPARYRPIEIAVNFGKTGRKVIKNQGIKVLVLF